MNGLEYPLPDAVASAGVLGWRKTEERVRRYLVEFAKENGLTEAVRYCHVATGDAADRISKLARELDADVIVTSTHGHTGWMRVFLGSTAERIVRYARCPVLIARERRNVPAAPISLRKILAPVDFSRKSATGLAYAVRLAAAFGASVTLLHVLPPDRYPTAGGMVVDPDPDLTARARAVAAERMRTLIGETDFGGVEHATAVRVGNVEDEICRFAKKNSFDLIVTSSHGRTGLRHAVLGSVAEHIARYAEGPVLVVPTRWRAKT